MAGPVVLFPAADPAAPPPAVPPTPAAASLRTMRNPAGGLVSPETPAHAVNNNVAEEHAEPDNFDSPRPAATNGDPQVSVARHHYNIAFLPYRSSERRLIRNPASATPANFGVNRATLGHGPHPGAPRAPGGDPALILDFIDAADRPTGYTPYNPDLTWDEAYAACSAPFLKCFNKRVDPHVRSNYSIKASKIRFVSSEKPTMLNIVHDSIWHLFNGYNNAPDASNYSIGQLASSSVESERLFYVQKVMPVINYFVIHMNPFGYLSAQKISMCNACNWEEDIKTKGQNFGVWSNKGVSERVLNPTDGFMCKGVMWEYALAIDSLVPDFVERVDNGMKFITQSQLVVLEGDGEDANRTTRMYRYLTN